MRTALVGNALSLFSQRYGREIDRHEQIVRLNRAAMLYTDLDAFSTHGSRTDAWYVWRLKEYETVQFHLPSRVMQMAYWEHTDKEVERYPEERYIALESELGSVPSTGIMSLDWLSRGLGLEVSAYGFDWKASPTFTDPDRKLDAKLNGGGSLHNFAREREYCMDVLKKDVLFRF